MEGKLYKINNIYTLMVNDKMVASNDEDFQIDYVIKKLSLKNCESIENGYDLEELAKDRFGNSSHHTNNRCSYKEGFQKALEILGDKKFNYDHLDKMFTCGKLYQDSKNEAYCFDNVLNKFQQTEWDVEIEMICPHPEDTYRCGMEYGCDADGCNHPNKVPYLDSDGCLILKRK